MTHSNIVPVFFFLNSKGKYLLCSQAYYYYNYIILYNSSIHHAMMVFPSIIKIAQKQKLIEHSEKQDIKRGKSA